MPAPPRTYEQQFTHYSRVKYNSLRDRCEPKWNHDHSRLLKAGVTVEFGLADFRTWMLGIFGEQGRAHCVYCECWVTPATFVPDHDVALARGGFNDFSNLVPCCETCNDIKGTLSGRWFRYLRKCLAEMPDAEANIIRGRLAKSEKLAAQARQMRGRLLAKTTTNTTEVKEPHE